MEPNAAYSRNAAKEFSFATRDSAGGEFPWRGPARTLPWSTDRAANRGIRSPGRSLAPSRPRWKRLCLPPVHQFRDSLTISHAEGSSRFIAHHGKTNIVKLIPAPPYLADSALLLRRVVRCNNAI